VSDSFVILLYNKGLFGFSHAIFKVFRSFKKCSDGSAADESEKESGKQNHYTDISHRAKRQPKPGGRCL